MPNNRPSMLTLLVLGLVGAGPAWAAPEAPVATVPAATPAAAPAPSAAERRARLVELRARQQAAPDDPEAAYQLGALYLDLGDPRSAAEQLQRAIDGETAAADAWLLLGRAWMAQGKLAEVQARIPMDEIADPEVQGEVRVLQGLAWIEKGRPDEARTRFKEALDLAPDLSSAYLGLARLNLAEGKTVAAGEALTSAAQGRRADPAEIADVRGELALASKDYAAAETAFQAALAARPTQTWRRRPLVQAQLGQGKTDAADANIEALLAESPREPAALYLSAYSAYLRKDYQRAYDTLSPMLRGKNVEAGVLFIAGAAAYWLNNYNQAAELLERFLQRQPADQTARRLLAATQLRLGDPAKVLTTLKPLLDDPNPGAGDLTLAGQAALLSGDGKTALVYLDQAAALEPDSTDIARLRGAARIATGDRAAGIAELQRVAAAGGEGAGNLEYALLEERLKAGDMKGLAEAAARYLAEHRDDPKALLLNGIALVRTGDLTGARKAFDQVLAISPDNTDALMGLADIELRSGNAAAAQAALEKARTRRPDDPLVLRNLAAVFMSSGKTDQAVAVLEAALKADPKHPDTLTALAGVLTAAGRPLEALRLLSERGDPKAPAILLARTRAQLRAGRVATAIADARALTELDPHSTAGFLELGRALILAGDYGGAQKALAQALTLEPQDPVATLRSARAGLLALRPPVPEDAAKRAIQRSNQALRQYPSSPDAALLLATLAVLTGQPESAIEVLKPLCAANPDPELVTALANAYVQASKPKEGIAALREHVQRLPKDLTVRLLLARFLMADKQYGAAAEQLATVLQDDWGNTAAQLDRAAALIQQGKAAEAKPHLAEAAKARPDDPRLKALQEAAAGRRPAGQ